MPYRPRRAAVVRSNGWRSSVLPPVILKAMIRPWWLMSRWSVKPKHQPWRYVPTGQPSVNILLPLGAGVVTDRQLAALHKGDAGGLATVAMEQEGKGQQESRHQGHNPAAAGGKLTTAVTELLLHPIGPEMLAVLVGAEMEQHHDEKHLAKGELACSLTLTA